MHAFSLHVAIENILHDTCWKVVGPQQLKRFHSPAGPDVFLRSGSLNATLANCNGLQLATGTYNIINAKGQEQGPALFQYVSARMHALCPFFFPVAPAQHQLDHIFFGLPFRSPHPARRGR